VLTFTPPTALAEMPSGLWSGSTTTVADTDSIEARKAKRKADEAAAAEALTQKKEAARLKKEQEDAAKPEKASVMNYSGESTSANEEFNTKLLFIAAAVTLVSPILGIQSARNAISAIKEDDMDLNQRDNTRNF